MRVENQSFSIGEAAKNTQGKDASGKAQVKNGTIKAFELNLVVDPIEERRKKAQEEIQKVLENVYNSQQEIDDSLRDRRERINALNEENLELTKENARIESHIEELAKEYGVAPDSEEQADYELLAKRSGNPNANFTEEEQARLANIDKNGMTEYQSRAMELHTIVNNNNSIIEKNEKNIRGEVGTITAVRIERLKSRPVEDALGEVEDIEEQLSKDLQAMLKDEVKENIDEVQEESIEKAKEEAEKKTEEEEALKKNDEQQTDKVTEHLVELDRLDDDIQKEVTNIKLKLNLTDEELLGMVVDKEV